MLVDNSAGSITFAAEIAFGWVLLNKGKHPFYTKGDKNKEVDEGFIKQHDIVGVAKLRIKYIGLPTLYLRELFERE